MSLSKVTILGFEKWLNTDSKSLFDFMELPEGIDKETLTDNILLQAGDFEVLYSNPYSMRDYVKIWAKKHYRTFDKWIKVLNIEYNPLENYDRMEEWTDDTTSNQKNGSTSNNKYNTYDDDTLHVKSQDVYESEADATGNAKHTGRIHGNIGVTTSQMMALSEIDLARFNIYTQITDLFMQEFCLMVYV